MKRRLPFFWTLCAGCIGLIVLVATILGGTLERSLRRDALTDLTAGLRARTALLEEVARPALRGDEAGFSLTLRALDANAGARLTVIRADGTVVADSEKDAQVMDNHLHRPEVQQALAHGEGVAQRPSDTLGIPFLYLARAVRGTGGELVGFVRCALPLDVVDARVAHLRALVLASSIGAALCAIAFAFYFARRISAPLRAVAELAEEIAHGEARRAPAVEGAAEIQRLSTAIRAMNEQLELRLAAATSDRAKVLAILGSMVEGVIAIDAAERVVHLNKVAAALLDVDAERSVGRRIWEVTRLGPVCEILERARTSAAACSRECRVPLVRDDKLDEVELELRASPLRDASGSAAGAVVVLHDVTALRKLETVRSDFVANVSHELKTPLTAIRGLVETMLDDRAMPSQTARRFLEKVRDQSARLSALVTDLLTLARVEARKEALELAPVDLCRLVHECGVRFADRCAQRGLALELDVPGTPLQLRSDEESLRQILDNLLDNACKYTPAGGRVTVRVVGAANEARIEVEDTGIGIEPRDQERVFERFYRVDKARSRELGGTGLGLSIVKHLAQALGGSVSLESYVGRGSTFRVHLTLPEGAAASIDAGLMRP